MGGREGSAGGCLTLGDGPEGAEVLLQPLLIRVKVEPPHEELPLLCRHAWVGARV